MKRGKRTIQMILCGILCAALLAGCRDVDLPPETTTEPAPSPSPVTYAVRFRVEGQTLSMQLVEEGSSPAAPEVSMEGYVFSHWLNEDGSSVEPDALNISADRVFTAVVYPDLGSHAPYLFADENGFIHPDGLLTGQDLDRALKALAVVDTALEHVAVPAENTRITVGDLQAVLELCFPADAVQSALTDPADTAVTRAGFARLMNALLDRRGPVVIADSQALPRDLALGEETADVLEAVLIHACDPEGKPIHEAVLEMPWQPGFANLGGWLYYADENGKVLLNSTLGTLTFGADGRYTCGDGALDAIAAELVAGFILENPAMEREELLFKAFEYTRDTFTYLGRGILEPGATGWEVERAKQMFEKGSGNCYNYAAVFWILARHLGYDAVCYSGKALSNTGNHAWVDIEFDGETYIFDPQLAWREMTGGRTNWGEDMFKIPERLWSQWRYIYP